MNLNNGMSIPHIDCAATPNKLMLSSLFMMWLGHKGHRDSNSLPFFFNGKWQALSYMPHWPQMVSSLLCPVCCQNFVELGLRLSRMSPFIVNDGHVMLHGQNAINGSSSLYHVHSFGWVQGKLSDIFSAPLKLVWHVYKSGLHDLSYGIECPGETLHVKLMGYRENRISKWRRITWHFHNHLDPSHLFCKHIQEKTYSFR